MEQNIFSISWTEILDIALVAFIFYQAILFTKGTRAMSVFFGLMLVVVIYYLAGKFGLVTLHWLLDNFLSSLFLVVIILFHQDIRKALSHMGAAGMWKRKQPVHDDMFKQVVDAVIIMAEKRIGAIIVIEKAVPLGEVREKGVFMDAVISSELLCSLFYMGTPLHDGAVIINKGRIAAAGCILPLGVLTQRKSHLGTRHRAAIGITQDTDAAAIVVSEERGQISLAIGGKLLEDLDEVRFSRVLRNAWQR